MLTTGGSASASAGASSAGGAAGAAGGFAGAAPYLAVIGAANQAIGSFYAAQSQKYQLKSQASSMRFQRSLSEISARQAEMQAQTLAMAGQRQLAQYTMRYAQQRASTTASMAARGGVLSEGSNLEIAASQEMIKEIDKLTINANTVRAVEAARLQRRNLLNQAAMQGVSAANLTSAAKTISPFASAATSLLGSASDAGMQYMMMQGA